MTERLAGDMLVVARNEFRSQLLEKIKPLLISGFQSMYEDAQKAVDKGLYNKNIMIAFQTFLKAIPSWSNLIIEKETERIVKSMGSDKLLSHLLSALFITNVKILAAVRLGGEHKNIKITICKSDVFIHKMYIHCAKVFYREPWIFEPTKDIKVANLNHQKIEMTIDNAIDSVIRELVPVDEILKEYLGSTMATAKDIVSSSEEEDSSDDSDSSDDESDTEKTGVKPPSSAVPWSRAQPQPPAQRPRSPIGWPGPGLPSAPPVVPQPPPAPSVQPQPVDDADESSDASSDADASDASDEDSENEDLEETLEKIPEEPSAPAAVAAPTVAAVAPTVAPANETNYSFIRK